MFYDIMDKILEFGEAIKGLFDGVFHKSKYADNKMGSSTTISRKVEEGSRVHKSSPVSNRRK